MNQYSLLDREQLLDLLRSREQQHATALAEKDSELEKKDGELQEKVTELEEKNLELQRKDDMIAQLEQQNQDWEYAYNQLWHQRFSARSERYIADPDQLRLDFGDTDEAADAANGLAEALEETAPTPPSPQRGKPRKKRDESLPAHLPRYEVTAAVGDEVKTCPTHGERTLLPESMWDRTESLEYEPPKRRVRVTVYPKYACPSEPQCGVVSPERPTGIVEGNKYDASVAAEIITHKFGYHMPIYRQQDYCATSGWTPSRSTLLNILTGSHFVLEPLIGYFRSTVQQDSIVGCDDTGVTLLNPKVLPQFDLEDPKQRRIHEVFSEALNENKPSIRAKMWAYRGQTIPLNVFDFTVSRHRDGPELFFADYEGTLLGDCWHGFESIACNSFGAIVRAACNAHARRKIRKSNAYPADRKLWLDWYQSLYDIEDRGKVLAAEERLALRRAEAAPIWEEMGGWLEDVKGRTKNVVLPKSDFAKALQYVRNHFTQLTLVSSAIRNDLSVWDYLHDVLKRLLSGETDNEPLLPWNWAQQHPEAIREYRIDERQQRAERKRAQRADRRRQNA
jgi:transposase